MNDPSIQTDVVIILFQGLPRESPTSTEGETIKDQDSLPT